MEKLIRELSEETQKVRFYKVDVDAQQEISKFVGGVHIMPTIFVYKAGATVKSMAGANPKGLRVRPVFSSSPFRRRARQRRPIVADPARCSPL